jgi:hypothetical protein
MKMMALRGASLLSKTMRIRDWLKRQISSEPSNLFISMKNCVTMMDKEGFFYGKQYS